MKRRSVLVSPYFLPFPIKLIFYVKVPYADTADRVVSLRRLKAVWARKKRKSGEGSVSGPITTTNFWVGCCLITSVRAKFTISCHVSPMLSSMLFILKSLAKSETCKFFFSFFFSIFPFSGNFYAVILSTSCRHRKGHIGHIESISHKCVGTYRLLLVNNICLVLGPFA